MERLLRRQFLVALGALNPKFVAGLSLIPLGHFFATLADLPEHPPDVAQSSCCRLILVLFRQLQTSRPPPFTLLPPPTPSPSSPLPSPPTPNMFPVTVTVPCHPKSCVPTSPSMWLLTNPLEMTLHHVALREFNRNWGKMFLSPQPNVPLFLKKKLGAPPLPRTQSNFFFAI